MKHPILPRGRELKLPIISGALLTFSFPPFHLLIPPFVALVPYLVFLAGCGSDRAGVRSAVRGTFWMGIVFYGTLLYWLFAALVFYTWLSALGYLIAVIVLSGFLAGAGYGIHRLRLRHRVPLWAALPIFWTAAEWIRGHLGDLSFPWLGLGHSLTGYPGLVGFADVVGARGVTFWLAAINGLLAEWWLARRAGVRPVRAVHLALVLLVPVTYSLVRWHTIETRPAARVLVVQPNIPEDLKLEREQAIDSSRTALGALTDRALGDESPIDLVVWPETALPHFRQLSPEWVRWTTGLAARENVHLLYGMLDLERYGPNDYEYFNAAIFVTPAEAAAGIYRKHYLVPVVERVPYIPLSWVRAARRSANDGLRVPLLGDIGSFLRWFGGYGRGDREPVFDVNGAGFGVLICYESIFPGLSRTYRRQGAEFLVNITNDAWFGRERPVWSQTSALYQHPAHLVMRAIENRVGIARAANTGISLFVDPRGRVVGRTPLFEPAARVREVETTDETTLYTRYGDWVGWGSMLGAAALLLASVARSRRG